MLALANDDVISGLECFLAAEIDIPPLLLIKKKASSMYIRYA